MDFLQQLIAVQSCVKHIGEKIPEIISVIQEEKQVFSSDDSNFRKVKDETQKGYVTFLTSQESLREVMIDSTEIPPTFSTNPPRTKQEKDKKKAEFRAYLLGFSNNQRAWQALLGPSFRKEDMPEMDAMIVGQNVNGCGSFLMRPKAKGNFTLGVLHARASKEKAQEMLGILQEIQKTKGRVGLLIVGKTSYDKKLFQSIDTQVILDKIPDDDFHLLPTLALKVTLNLISNGVMLSMGKVYGNIMIDLKASNYKLIDRTCRIVQEIYSRKHPKAPPIHRECLYDMVCRVKHLKNIMESEYGRYVPSLVKLILTMLEDKKSPFAAIEKLQKNNELI